MSLLSAIRGIFAVAPKTANDVFDKDSGLLVKTGRFIDGLFYTDQEKAQAAAEIAKSVGEFVKATLTESTERSQTRRSVALLWIKAQLGLIMLCAITIPVDEILKTRMAEAYFKLATCHVLVGGTISIIIFFFGYYGWNAYVKKNGEKK